MTQNPNWPLIDEAISFGSGPNSAAPFPYWCSVIGRTEGRWTSQRGRQYETDQIQSARIESTLRNDDAALDQSNTSSSFYPQVTPYRGYRRRAQLPATVNLLTADQATAWYQTHGAYSGSVLPQWVGSVTGSTVTVGNNAGPPPFNYYQVPAAAAFETVAFFGFSVTPGQVYTGQCKANCSTGVTAEIALRFVDVNGNTLTGTGGGTTTSASGAVITVTATAPSNAAGAVLYVQNNAAVAGGAVFNVWNVQVEANSTASAYVTPGTWYDMFTGFVERWPQTWTDGGTYGVSRLTCVDAIAYLSQRRLRSPAYMEILALGPDFLYPLDEASGSIFYDLTATLPVGTATISASGNAAQVAPGTILATTGGTLPQGTGGPVVHFDNQSNPGSVAAITLPTSLGGLQTGAFTRVFAMRCTSTGSWQNPAAIWDAQDVATGSNYIHFYGWGTGYLNLDVRRSGTLTYSATNLPQIMDSRWHMVALTCSADGKSWVLYFDGAAFDSQTLTSDGRPLLSGVGTVDQLGAQVINTGGYGGFQGELAIAAQIPFALTAAQVQALYSAWMYGGSGLGVASSGTRYQDVLRWAQWAGQSSVDTFTTGECTTYGPSIDLNATAAQPGTDGVSAGQTVVDTDDGEQYVDRSGVVTFHARGWRFNKTPAVTFGDGTGEIPYTDCSFGLDPTRLANDAAITQTSTQTAVTKVDTASIGTYGDVQIQRNVNDTNTYSLGDMAQYLSTHYATPVQRLETLRIEPATYTVNGAPSTAAWQACLSLELGTPVQVNRRPPNGPAISFSGFVEQINWTMDDRGTAVCELQVSPNYGKQFWTLDSSTYSVLGSTTILGY